MKMRMIRAPFHHQIGFSQTLSEGKLNTSPAATSLRPSEELSSAIGAEMSSFLRFDHENGHATSSSSSSDGIFLDSYDEKSLIHCGGQRPLEELTSRTEAQMSTCLRFDHENGNAASTFSSSDWIFRDSLRKEKPSRSRVATSLSPLEELSSGKTGNIVTFAIRSRK